MPRSRSFWISKYLSYGGWHCDHDASRHFRSLDDVRSWLAQPGTGTVETAAAPFWRLLLSYRADVRVAVIRRPVPEVVASIAAKLPPLDVGHLERYLRRLDAKLDQIERRVPGVLSVSYEELRTEAGCAALFEHCLPYAHDPAWWERLAPINLQVDLVPMVRYAMAFAPQLEKIAKTAKHRMLANMMPPERGDDGITFQVEPARTFYRDAQPLFAEHLVQTEQPPDEYQRKNVPLITRLDDIGALQILTARCNGRMFGYLMSIIGPSLDNRTELQAEHTIFFASPAFRNLGMRLQREAIRRLRERGVANIIMRAGHRGSGPRLGAVYRRLGAEPFGAMYRLELQEAA